MLRGKFIALQAYLKKQEKSQIHNLTLHLKQLEKEEMENPRVSRRTEISAAAANRLHGGIRRKNEAHSTKNKYRQIVIANGGAENTENNNC